MSTSHLQHGDYVRLKSEDLDGIVVEVKTRSVVVRVRERSGKERERHVDADDLERLPTTKEAGLERPRTQPVPVMTFAADRARWFSIDDAHLRENRVHAWLSALRTMHRELNDNGIEQSVSLVGLRGRRVLTVSAIEGHDVFHKMQNAWDAHKTYMEHHDIPERRSLDIVRVLATGGTARLDEEPEYAYAFISVKAPPAEMSPFMASAQALLERRGVTGLQGGALFAGDDDGHHVLFTRWSSRNEAAAFAADARHHVVLPPTEHLGVEAEAYEVVASYAC